MLPFVWSKLVDENAVGSVVWAVYMLCISALLLVQNNVFRSSFYWDWIYSHGASEKVNICVTGSRSLSREDTTMDQISIKTSNPKCCLYWCLIEFIDWSGDTVSHVGISTTLWSIALLTFSLVSSPPPPPLCEWVRILYTRIQCVREGGGVWGHRKGWGVRQINTCRQEPLLVNF